MLCWWVEISEIRFHQSEYHFCILYSWRSYVGNQSTFESDIFNLTVAFFCMFNQVFYIFWSDIFFSSYNFKSLILFFTVFFFMQQFFTLLQPPSDFERLFKKIFFCKKINIWIFQLLVCSWKIFSSNLLKLFKWNCIYIPL